MNRHIIVKSMTFSFQVGEGKHVILVYIVPLLIGLEIADISKYNNFINGQDIEPLRDLFREDEIERVLIRMLNNDESFDKEMGKKFVTQEEIIKRFYNAIFLLHNIVEVSITLS